MNQGDIWWGELPDVPGRPYLVLSRQHAIPVLRTVLAAPVTRTVRGISSEVPLGSADGLRVECVASFDNVVTVPKLAFTRKVGALAAGRWPEVCAAVSAAIDC